MEIYKVVLLILFILGIVAYKPNRKKTPILILFAGSIILSIYIFMHVYNFKNQLERLNSEDYKEIKNKPRVVVSFTTIPSRVKHLHQTLDKLKKQTLKPDTIYVNIPYFSVRLRKKYNLNDIGMYTPDSNVVLNRCRDYGPATKLLGCLEHEKDPNTIIITIDDDQDYKSHVFETLALYSMKYKGKIVAFNTLTKNLLPTICPFTKNTKTPNAYILEGFGGVGYRRSFISDDIIDYFKDIHHNMDCFLSDDLTLSTWMRIKGYDIVKICGYKNRDTMKNIDINDALHRESREKVYKYCNADMKKLLKEKL